MGTATTLQKDIAKILLKCVHNENKCTYYDDVKRKLSTDISQKVLWDNLGGNFKD